jgi:aminoacyl tRNA synthase complex-interacting multifunctional protein 1
MLLCLSVGSLPLKQVEPLTPPEGAIPGELIKFEGHASTPVEPGNKATKAFSKIADDFFVDDNFVATYKGIPFLTPQGLIKSSLKGKIS